MSTGKFWFNCLLKVSISELLNYQIRLVILLNEDTLKIKCPCTLEKQT